MNAQGTASQRACKVLVGTETRPRRRQAGVARGRRSSRAFIFEDAQSRAVLGIGGQRLEAEKVRRLARPSTTVRAGSGPAATPARCSNAQPRLRAGRTQSVVGRAPRWREKNNGRPPSNPIGFCRWRPIKRKRYQRWGGRSTGFCHTRRRRVRNPPPGPPLPPLTCASWALCLRR